MTEQFIGAGWSYPVRTDAGGRVALSRGDDEIRESIRLILGTAYGERPMRPDFGCRIHDMVFGTADASFAGRVAHEVRASLVRWEPRVTVRDVDVSFDKDDRNTVLVSVSYTVNTQNDPRNLVFPFYFIPEHEE